MNTVLHKASTRGFANHGWLVSHHSFSFANYYNPERMNFGALRVLNDDTVAGGKGFDLHPHDNMEIVSIPLEGSLEHKDNMGNKTIIPSGDIQAMSAGTGIFHSEYNKNIDRSVKFLQIWLFPNKKNVVPSYNQTTLHNYQCEDKFAQILSPNSKDEGVYIQQNAWFFIGNFTKEQTQHYTLKDKANGVYCFILEGNATIEGQALNKRDGFGIWQTNSISVHIKDTAKILLMEVPMS